MTPREKIESLIAQYGSSLPGHESCNNHMREAILAGIRQVLEQHISRAMILAGCDAWEKHAQDVREKSDIDETLRAFWSAMTAQLLKELEA